MIEGERDSKLEHVGSECVSKIQALAELGSKIAELRVASNDQQKIKLCDARRQVDKLMTNFLRVCEQAAKRYGNDDD